MLFATFSCVFYVIFAYNLKRADFPQLLALYGGLFFLFVLYLKKWRAGFSAVAGLAILFRLVFIPAIPNLSQDFYRFIWDGRLLVQGLNPYLTTPLSYIDAGNFSIVAQAQELYAGMGMLNGKHFTNYPPVNQLLFSIAALVSSKSIVGSVMVFRISTILADVGIIYFGKKLLERLGMKPYHIFWYALNPFIIIEMTGNLHFESVMLFFVVWSLYLLAQGKWVLSAIVLALSVSTKLIPLLLLPLFLQYFLTEGGGIRKSHFRSSYPWGYRFRESVKNLPRLIYFYLIVILTVFLTFLPFLTGQFAENFGASIALWFKNFEFNASVYYIIRWIGYELVGWNIIWDVGPKLPIFVVIFLILLAFFRKNVTMSQMITSMLFGISFYFLLSTTVHPWYVATPLLLCVFTRYRFPLVWSFTIMLSYSAYTDGGFQENLWLVATEYALVIGYFFWELFRKPNDVALSI
ncbi:mannosyltransferase [Dokdonia sinensis]|uniref:Mannosyltransferase n=1 Tax=Dokdonia sinensis TaxID=2479847 RepID=A0A3M0G1G5_9FLAO|nr:mannosyltransferase [Dokdonia sinensis]